MKYIQFGKIRNTVKRVRSLINFVLVVSLWGCSSLPNDPSRLPGQVQQLTVWESRGKIMLSEGKDKNSGYFLWQQDQDEFRFSISSFIGTNVFSLSHKNGQTKLKVDGKNYTGSNPDILLYQVTGQSIPVLELRNWLLAQPSDNILAPQYNEAGSITAFDYQAANGDVWKLNYRTRMKVAGFELPQSINLKSSNKRIKISVSDWQLIK